MADEFDDVADDLADLQNVDWDNILGSNPAAIPGPSSPWAANSASSASSQYVLDDEIDDSFLHELDQLEYRLTQNPALRPAVPATPSMSLPSSFMYVLHPYPVQSIHALPTCPHPVPQSSRFFNGALAPSTNLVHQPLNTLLTRSPLKRTRSPSQNEYPHSPAKKGKTNPNLDETHFWEAFEDEVICPICCDLFVGAQVGNPCGHSFCGECGLLWLQKNRKNGCPICRSTFTPSRSMIPNIAVDNIVEKYIMALRASGDKDWGPDGSKYKEWFSRKQRWKKEVAERANLSRLAQKPPLQVINMTDLDLFPEEGEDDEDYEDDDEDEDDVVELLPPRVPRESRTRVQRAHYR